MAKTLTKPTDYTDAEIDRALAATAYYNGSYTKARKALAEQGLDIPLHTIRNWKEGRTKAYAGRYEKIQKDLLPKIHAEVAEAHTELAMTSIDLERKMAERLHNEIGDIPIRDLPNAHRNAATSSGIHTDKAALLRGMAGATDAQGNRNVKEIITALSAKGISLKIDIGPQEKSEKAVEGTAKEITDE